MNELIRYKYLLTLLEQMIQDKVQLIHGGQIIEWDDTQIPDIIKEIKKDAENNDKYIIFKNNEN